MGQAGSRTRPLRFPGDCRLPPCCCPRRQLHFRYVPSRWLARSPLQRADHDDLIQEVLQIVVRKLPEFQRRREGSFRAWLACDQGRVIAGGAVVITAWPAHPYDLACRRATILNVYTEPGYRRRGIARQIMQTMISWCKQEGLARLTLHASEEGRRLYESLGFEPSNEMRLNLR